MNILPEELQKPLRKIPRVTPKEVPVKSLDEISLTQEEMLESYPEKKRSP